MINERRMLYKKHSQNCKSTVFGQVTIKKLWTHLKRLQYRNISIAGLELRNKYKDYISDSILAF